VTLSAHAQTRLLMLGLDRLGPARERPDGTVVISLRDVVAVVDARGVSFRLGAGGGP
jgi:hypothetical protein